MKRLFSVAMLIFVAVSFAASQMTEQKLTGSNLKIKQELIKLEEDWHNAYLKRDAEPLERILADEYIFVGVGGNGNKAQAISGLKADTSVYEYSTPYDMDFRFYGNTVIVIGRTKEKGKAQNGTEFVSEFRWTDVFIKKNGRWQCVVAQVVRVPAPKPKQ
jgi:ketosteroid isomerase-like protein